MAPAKLTRLTVRATDSPLGGNYGPASRSGCLPSGRGNDAGGMEPSESNNSSGVRFEEQRQ